MEPTKGGRPPHKAREKPEEKPKPKKSPSTPEQVFANTQGQEQEPRKLLDSKFTKKSGDSQSTNVMNQNFLIGPIKSSSNTKDLINDMGGVPTLFDFNNIDIAAIANAFLNPNSSEFVILIHNLDSGNLEECSNDTGEFDPHNRPCAFFDGKNNTITMNDKLPKSALSSLATTLGRSSLNGIKIAVASGDDFKTLCESILETIEELLEALNAEKQKKGPKTGGAVATNSTTKPKDLLPSQATSKGIDGSATGKSNESKAKDSNEELESIIAKSAERKRRRKKKDNKLTEAKKDIESKEISNQEHRKKME